MLDRIQKNFHLIIDLATRSFYLHFDLVILFFLVWPLLHIIDSRLIESHSFCEFLQSTKLWSFLIGSKRGMSPHSCVLKSCKEALHIFGLLINRSLR